MAIMQHLSTPHGPFKVIYFTHLLFTEQTWARAPSAVSWMAALPCPPEILAPRRGFTLPITAVCTLLWGTLPPTHPGGLCSIPYEWKRALNLSAFSSDSGSPGGAHPLLGSEVMLELQADKPGLPVAQTGPDPEVPGRGYWAPHDVGLL